MCSHVMIDFGHLPLFHVVIGQKEGGEVIRSSGKKDYKIIKARHVMITHDRICLTQQNKNDKKSTT